jgi:hypothetical protein
MKALGIFCLLLIPLVATGSPSELRANDYCQIASEFRGMTGLEQSEFFLGLKLASIKDCAPELVRKEINNQIGVGSYKMPELNDVENLLIIDYVGSAYDYINRQLISGRSTKITTLFGQALSKLPNYRGVVYHGNQMKMELFRPGMIIAYKGYLSTSFGTDSPQEFSMHWGLNPSTNKEEYYLSGTLFKIHVYNGKDLSDTFNPDEKEVLIPPPSRFKVLGKIREKNLDMIELEQIN